MIFTASIIHGAFFIDLEPREDHRGFFARSWCQKEFEEHGLNPGAVQINVGFSGVKGTVRGMHYQAAPYEEVKVARCTMGAIYDVIIDLRGSSPTLKQWLAVELTAENRKMLYIPEGFAHGFQTLAVDAEVLYQMSEFYQAEAARGIRWDDPTFRIVWPESAKRIISQKDLSYPDYRA